MQLLIGCGSSRSKKLSVSGRSDWDGLVTLDHEECHKPDVVHDLNYACLPFDNDTADEIHAYEVLEHTGSQGDYKFFFEQFSDFWRVLKNGGMLFGTVPLPNSVWAWGDPSHTRIVQKESFVFLNQPAYAQVGITPMSDFRSIYKADFDIIYSKENGECFEFALQAVKPSRIKT